jgi:predicted transposase/invertase (TIGR01784 family)
MQIDLTRDCYVDRSVYSLARLHGEALKKGARYADTSKTICVHFLDGVLFPDEPLHATASMRFDETKNQVNDKLQLHYIQLGKFNKKLSEIEENDTESLIYRLFKVKTWEELRTMEEIRNETMNNLAYSMTIVEGDSLSYERNRLLEIANYVDMIEFKKLGKSKEEFEQHLINKRMFRECIKSGIAIGEQSGIEKGIEKGISETIEGLLGINMPLPQIASVLKRPESKIEEIIKRNVKCEDGVPADDEWIARYRDRTEPQQDYENERDDGWER